MQSDVSCAQYNNVTGAQTIDWVSLVLPSVYVCVAVFSTAPSIGDVLRS